MKTRTVLLGLALVLGTRWAAALDPTGTVQVTPLLKTTTTWNGAPLAYPTGTPEVTALLIEIAPGGETGWHRHQVPSFALVLAGTLEVRLEDGSVNRRTAGDAFAEVVGTLHNGRNVGTEPVKIAVFYAGVQGQPLSEKAPPPR
jgi:quercetin dioxygenase-like cupin family protein